VLGKLAQALLGFVQLAVGALAGAARFIRLDGA
jgi:hypothetical protein